MACRLSFDGVIGSVNPTRTLYKENDMPLRKLVFAILLALCVGLGVQHAALADGGRTTGADHYRVSTPPPPSLTGGTEWG
jgi:hypothetical protein